MISNSVHPNIIATSNICLTIAIQDYFAGKIMSIELMEGQATAFLFGVKEMSGIFCRKATKADLPEVLFLDSSIYNYINRI
jgi:hypothetical protein